MRSRSRGGALQQSERGASGSDTDPYITHSSAAANTLAIPLILPLGSESPSLIRKAQRLWPRVCSKKEPERKSSL